MVTEERQKMSCVKMLEKNVQMATGISGEIMRVTDSSYIRSPEVRRLEKQLEEDLERFQQTDVPCKKKWVESYKETMKRYYDRHPEDKPKYRKKKILLKDLAQQIVELQKRQNDKKGRFSDMPEDQIFNEFDTLSQKPQEDDTVFLDGKEPDFEESEEPMQSEEERQQDVKNTVAMMKQRLADGKDTETAPSDTEGVEETGTSESENVKETLEEPKDIGQIGDKVPSPRLQCDDTPNYNAVMRSARKLLLDARRREIFMLCKKSMSVPIISIKVGKSPDAVWFHLKKLISADLVQNISYDNTKCNEIIMTDFGRKVLTEVLGDAK